MGLSSRNSDRNPLLEPPLSRDIIDQALPWLRLSMGAIFVAFCGLSTIFGAHDDLVSMLMGYAEPIERTIGIGLSALCYIGGLCIAAIVFVGEVATAERYRRIYFIFLSVDIYYSMPWSHTIMRFLISDSILAATRVEWLCGFVMAVVVAYYGEILIFGSRRRGM